MSNSLPVFLNLGVHSIRIFCQYCCDRHMPKMMMTNHEQVIAKRYDCDHMITSDGL